MTETTRLVEGKVAIITGAGRGLGREHALLLADHGAKVLVNDLGATGAGLGADEGPAHEVAELIRSRGGEALVNGSDVADFAAAGEMVQQAIDAWGQVDILINNAGFLRDRMIFSMEEDDWDAVINVHLKGHFCPTRHVTAHWRARTKAGEEDLDARIINTASPSGLYGNVGQSNYGAAKAGIAALTTVWALELARMGVTVNCLAPTAMTRLVMDVMGGEDAVSDEMKESMAPRWISALGGVAVQRRGPQRDRSGLRHPRRPHPDRRGMARRPGRGEPRRPDRARAGDRQAHGRGPSQQRPLRRGRRRPRPPLPRHLTACEGTVHARGRGPTGSRSAG